MPSISFSTRGGGMHAIRLIQKKPVTYFLAMRRTLSTSRPRSSLKEMKKLRTRSIQNSVSTITSTAFQPGSSSPIGSEPSGPMWKMQKERR